MSILNYIPFVGSSSGLSKSSNTAYLTQAQADTIYSKTNGNAFFSNATIIGTNTSQEEVVNDNLKVTNNATINGTLSVAKTASISDSLTVTNDVNVNRNFVVANTLSANASGGLHVTNKAIVDNDLTVSGKLNLASIPSLSASALPVNSLDLVTKQYVDNSISAQKDTYVCGYQTTVSLNSSVNPNNYYFKSPPAGTNAYTFYINFPATSGTSNLPATSGLGTSNNLYVPSCTFDFNYSFTQSQAISTINAIGSAATGQTYQIASLPPSSLILPSISTTMSPYGFINAKFFVCIMNGIVYAYAPFQSTTIWNNSITNGIMTNSSQQITTKYGTTPVSYSTTVINFTYTSDTKIKVDIKFPIVNQSVVANDPRQAGWISSYNASVKLSSSNPASSTSNFFITPNTNSNSNSGGAYLSIA
jgi:hypothetical protein